jgi:flagellar basal-body rod modification protein FlgD
MQTGMVDNTSSTTSSTGSTTSAAKNALDKNAFLSLLVAQLKNQDPTNAQDPNQMVSQMAQFSALEQQQNTNGLLTSLQSQMSAMYQTQAAGLVGKNVQVTSSSLNLQNGAASIGINLPSAAANVSVGILNASGRQVATLTPGAMGSGSQVLKWNGKDSSGNQLADGTYTVAIDARATDGSAIAATTTSYATVTGVSFTNGVVTVTAGGQQYPLSAVNAVSN